MAAAQPAPGRVDLAVSASVAREDYRPGDAVEVTLLVRNDGDLASDGVVVRVAGNTSVSSWDMGPFRDEGLGAGEYVGPGEEKGVSFTFELPAVPAPVIEFTVDSPAVDADPANDRFVLAVPVPLASLDGVLYGDRDLDRVVDPGEGLSGVELALQHEVDPYPAVVVRTGQGGRISVPQLVAGRYYLFAGLAPGWKLDTAPATAYLDVAEGVNAPVIRSVRVLKPPLTASIRFDRDSYAVGDVIREHVRLTNTGSADLSGITALCTGMGNANELGSPGWGDLAAYTGAGITVRAGQTREFVFTDVVPRGGWEYGRVQIHCWFAVDSDHLSGVMAGAQAAVPGGRGGLGGILHVDLDLNGYQDGEGLPGVKMYLVDGAGRIAGRTVTDHTGRFAFVSVPAANYEVRVVGPWRYVDHGVEFAQVKAEQFGDGRHLRVLPGPTQPDPDAPPPAAPAPSTPDGPPAPQGRVGVAGGLADTGAGVRELTGLGAGLLLVGLWLFFLPLGSRRDS